MNAAVNKRLKALKKKYRKMKKRVKSFLTKFKKPDFDYLEIVLTTNCSLRCKDCANLMQYYDVRPFTDKSILLSDIDKLLASVSGIRSMGVLGGEPLLYPYLDSVLEKLIQSPKVRGIRLATNGTIYPKPEIIDLLKNDKVTVWVSNYGTISKHLQDIITIPGIKYKISKSDKIWFDFGDLNRRLRSEEEVRKQYVKCHSECCSFYNGCIYRCPRAGHGYDLGKIPLQDNEIVRVREGKKPRSIANKIKAFKKIPYSEACFYCNKGTDQFKHIPPAIQLERNSKPYSDNP